MKTEHYPDLERCKKLSGVFFPDTELHWINMEDTDDHADIVNNKIPVDFHEYASAYVCPSIAELLERMPRKVTEVEMGDKYMWDVMFYRTKNLNQDRYKVVIGQLFETIDTLPNALSDAYIWLKENRHIE